MAKGSLSNYVILFIVSRLLVSCSSEVSWIGGLTKGKLEAQVTSLSSNRLLLNNLKTTVDVFPTHETQTPTIVTVPATVTPVLVTPTNPTTTPVSVPTMTPVIFPQPTSSVPLTVPVTNPVTTYPSPPNLPGVTPPATVYNPVSPPAVTGQSWCVAKEGAPEQALQAALDYACGIGGADCSQIQMGASCYSPITLQNHASYAFNSYYQRNPIAMSCDFGGVAVVVSTNPSTGSCIYQTGATSTAPTTTTPITTTPVVPTPTTSLPAGVPVPLSSGIGAPPLFNSGNPASVFGYGNPPPPFSINSMSASAKMKPHLGGVIVLLVISASTELMLRK